MKKFVSLSTGVRESVQSEQGKADGVPVIFLHGVTDSWRSFERVLPLLPAGHPRVRHLAARPRRFESSDVRLPLRGHVGGSARVPGRDGASDAMIVGHSMGASVAQRFVIDHPDRVAASCSWARSRIIPIPGWPTSWHRRFATDRSDRLPVRKRMAVEHPRTRHVRRPPRRCRLRNAEGPGARVARGVQWILEDPGLHE